jgi:hypothetical protein
MALFIRQSEDRSKLQERLAAELQEKARKRAEVERPDGVTDSNYLKDTKTTTSLAWVWIFVVVLAVGAFVFIMLSR